MTTAVTSKSGGLPEILSRPYKYLRLEWTGELGMLRVRTCVKPIQCYSLAGLTEMQRVLDDIAENPGVVRHLVLSSDVTGAEIEVDGAFVGSTPMTKALPAGNHKVVVRDGQRSWERILAVQAGENVNVQANLGNRRLASAAGAAR